MMQPTISKYWNILKFHGPLKGPRRALEQLTQIDLYDLKHGINTRQIVAGDEFFSAIAEEEGVTVHYQPVYTDAIKRPLEWLLPYAWSARAPVFIDLGCGAGKALHVATEVMPCATTIGVDLHDGLLSRARINKFVQCPQITRFLLKANVIDVDYQNLLTAYDVVFVFNKNSFDHGTTAELNRRLKAIGKGIFYIYNNPVYADLFREPIWEMRGWHKNWNTKVFQL